MKRIASLPEPFMKQALAAGVIGPEKVRDQAIVKDYENGMNIQAIADKHCLSKICVYRVIRKYP